MGGIHISSPPSSPTYPSHASLPRRFRPTLPALAFFTFHIALFLCYQHSLQAARTAASASTAVVAVTERPDPTVALVAGGGTATASCEVCHLDLFNPLCECGQPCRADIHQLVRCAWNQGCTETGFRAKRNRKQCVFGSLGSSVGLAGGNVRKGIENEMQRNDDQGRWRLGRRFYVVDLGCTD